MDTSKKAKITKVDETDFKVKIDSATQRKNQNEYLCEMTILAETYKLVKELHNSQTTLHTRINRLETNVKMLLNGGRFIYTEN